MPLSVLVRPSDSSNQVTVGSLEAHLKDTSSYRVALNPDRSELTRSFSSRMPQSILDVLFGDLSLKHPVSGVACVLHDDSRYWMVLKAVTERVAPLGAVDPPRNEEV